MGVGTKNVNIVGVNGVNPDEAQFEAMYNVKVNFLIIRGGNYRANYQDRVEVKVGIEMRDAEIVIEIYVFITPL